MGPYQYPDFSFRNTTWAKAANVVYLDNPVGSGFSYVDDVSLLPTNNAEIAADVVSLLKNLTVLYPSMVTQPV
jgi:serine carboxypeptidase 1